MKRQLRRLMQIRFIRQTVQKSYKLSKEDSKRKSKVSNQKYLEEEDEDENENIGVDNDTYVQNMNIAIESLINQILNWSEIQGSIERQLAHSFLLFVSQVEHNNQQANVVKMNCIYNSCASQNTYYASENTLVHTNNGFNSVRRKSKYNLDFILNNKFNSTATDDIRINCSEEELVENSLLHCINIESTKCIRYVVNNAHKLNIQIQIDYKVVLGLLFEIEQAKTKSIINEIINKDIHIVFDSEEHQKENSPSKNIQEECKLIEEEKMLSNFYISRERERNVNKIDRTGETTFDKNMFLFSSTEKDFDKIYDSRNQKSNIAKISTKRSKRSIKNIYVKAQQTIDIKNLIEMSFQYGDFDNHKIFTIIINLLEFSDKSYDCKMTLYPMFIYKMIICYEEMSIFEALFTNEINANSIDAARIISDCFIYAIGIDKIVVAAYISTKFSAYLFKMKDATCSGLLQIFQEYLSTQQNICLQLGICCFEEKLYFIELCINYFNSDHAKLLISIFK